MPQLSYDYLASYVSQALRVPQQELEQSYRPARESEIPAILQLRRAVNGTMWWDDEAFVRWRYFSRLTPAGTAPYWVFARGDEIIGACGLEPVDLSVEGTLVPAVRTLDIMVRPDLDGLGLGAFMNLMLFRHFPIILVTGSNARSHQLLMRMFHHTADLRFWKTVVTSRVVVDEKVNLGPLSRVLTAPADLLLSLARASRHVDPPSGLLIREVSTFDEHVTELSRRCEEPGRIQVRRSCEYLNWRFFRNSRCSHRVFVAVSNTRLEGYIVTRFNQARPNPRCEAEIVDWLASGDGDRGAILRSLMQAALEALVHQGARLVSCAAHAPDIDAAVEANGFRLRPAERLPFFIKAADSAVHERLSAGDRWFLTRGDYDVE